MKKYLKVCFALLFVLAIFINIHYITNNTICKTMFSACKIKVVNFNVLYTFSFGAKQIDGDVEKNSGLFCSAADCAFL